MSPTYYLWWLVSPVFFYIGISSIPDWLFVIAGIFFSIVTFYIGYCRYNEYQRYSYLENLKTEALAKQLRDQGAKCPFLDEDE